MDGQYMNHKEVPYGWVLWVKPAIRGILRLLGAKADRGAPKPTCHPQPPRYRGAPRWWGA